MTNHQPDRTWRSELVARYPHLFNCTSTGETYAPGCPTVGDGWRDLVETASRRISDVSAAAPEASVTIEQIKEKFGCLRFYWSGRDLSEAVKHAIKETVALAVARSGCTCEVCGAPACRTNAPAGLQLLVPTTPAVSRSGSSPASKTCTSSARSSLAAHASFRASATTANATRLWTSIRNPWGYVDGALPMPLLRRRRLDRIRSGVSCVSGVRVDRCPDRGSYRGIGKLLFL